MMMMMPRDFMRGKCAAGDGCSRWCMHALFVISGLGTGTGAACSPCIAMHSLAVIDAVGDGNACRKRVAVAMKQSIRLFNARHCQPASGRSW